MANFYDEQTDHSKVKSLMVERYFKAWSTVILSTLKNNASTRTDGRLAYIDLYAGKGVYDDGTASTPIKILAQAIADPELRKRLVTIFNDYNFADELRFNIDAIKGINRLAYKPKVGSSEVGDEIATQFSTTNMIPAFCFVDPWGYKGLSQKLLVGMLKDWGCDCLFFFNYNRVNMGISNGSVASHMQALFGETVFTQLQKDVEGLTPTERRATVLNALSESLYNALGNQGFILPFCFESQKNIQTSHYLVFVSKHPLGYNIMKGIMVGLSDEADDTTPLFEFAPTKNAQLQWIYPLTMSVTDLPEILLSQYAGQRINRDQLVADHIYGPPFIKKHYNAALKILEGRGAIGIETSKPNRRKGTYADHVTLVFP